MAGVAPLPEWRQRRWYDKNPQASKAIQYLLAFPEVFQDVICQTILDLTSQLPLDSIEPLKSLGAENILSVYKAKQKRRDYDQRGLTHDTMRQLSVLPEDKRAMMTQHIHHITRGFRQYLRLCQQFKAKPNLIEVRKLLAQYQASGSQGCDSMLQSLQEEWEQKALINSPNLAFINTPKINTARSKGGNPPSSQVIP